MSYLQQNTDSIEKARQASLADFFTQNGFETERIRNELHVKGYGGLYVNTETNEWYCFSQAEKHGGRNAINCLTDIIGMDFKSAVEALSGANMTYMDYHRDTPKLPQTKKLFCRSVRTICEMCLRTSVRHGGLTANLFPNWLMMVCYIRTSEGMPCFSTRTKTVIP